jgi:hypothetical protein
LEFTLPDDVFLILSKDRIFSAASFTNQRRRLNLANPIDGGYYGLVTSNGPDRTSGVPLSTNLLL